MAVSGSYDFTLNRDQIISAALRVLRVLGQGQTADSDHITNGSQALNLMLKSWAMDGLNLWLNQEVVLHLAEDAQTYKLGAEASTSADWADIDDAGYTQLSADSAANDTTLEVDSDDNIADGDNIGIELDDGSLEWTTVNGSPASDVVTITTGLTSAAATDNYVFHYTNKAQRPTDILEARLRDTDDNDEPIEIHRSRREFMAITDKTSTGDCMDIFYDPQITEGILYTWPVCDDVTKRIVMTIARVINDMDASANNFDLPNECLNAVKYCLAVEMAPEMGVALFSGKGADIMAKANQEYDKLKRHYANKEPIYFQP